MKPTVLAALGGGVRRRSGRRTGRRSARPGGAWAAACGRCAWSGPPLSVYSASKTPKMLAAPSCSPSTGTVMVPVQPVLEVIWWRVAVVAERVGDLDPGAVDRAVLRVGDGDRERHGVAEGEQLAVGRELRASRSGAVLPTVTTTLAVPVRPAGSRDRQRRPCRCRWWCRSWSGWPPWRWCRRRRSTSRSARRPRGRSCRPRRSATVSGAGPEVLLAGALAIGLRLPPPMYSIR